VSPLPAAPVLARLALSEVMSFRVAVVLAYLAGMVTAFLLSKVWVFETSGRSATAAARRAGLGLPRRSTSRGLIARGTR
jgi:putative flippase GtrA